MRLGYGWPKRYNRVNEQGRSYVSRAGIGASSIISKFQKQRTQYLRSDTLSSYKHLEKYCFLFYCSKETKFSEAGEDMLPNAPSMAMSLRMTKHCNFNSKVWLCQPLF